MPRQYKEGGGARGRVCDATHIEATALRGRERSESERPNAAQRKKKDLIVPFLGVDELSDEDLVPGEFVFR